LIDLLRKARTAGDLRAALEALPNDARLREALVESYDALAAGPKRDPAASLRAELLRALRPLVTVADRERLEEALVTYEFGPLGENCSGLRAAALLALGDLDPDLAELYAVHLLADGHTEHMSGEPALTAVQFLVRRGALATVYLHALRAGEAQEDRAEALRNLASLPARWSWNWPTRWPRAAASAPWSVSSTCSPPTTGPRPSPASSRNGPSTPRSSTSWISPWPRPWPSTASQSSTRSRKHGG